METNKKKKTIHQHDTISNFIISDLRPAFSSQTTKKDFCENRKKNGLI